MMDSCKQGNESSGPKIDAKFLYWLSNEKICKGRNQLFFLSREVLNQLTELLRIQ
jgi:hypothetical protein